jgi:hypothetical protein
MSRNLTELAGYAVDATDGEIGKVHDFLFDDERWTIRYLVVQTGGFFDDRRVLISPVSFREVHWFDRRFRLDLTRDKVKNSPGVDRCATWSSIPVTGGGDRRCWSRPTGPRVSAGRTGRSSSTCPAKPSSAVLPGTARRFTVNTR